MGYFSSLLIDSSTVSPEIARAKAMELAYSIDHQFEGEGLDVYTFVDGSALVVNGVYICAYKDKAEAWASNGLTEEGLKASYERHLSETQSNEDQMVIEGEECDIDADRSNDYGIEP